MSGAVIHVSSGDHLKVEFVLGGLVESFSRLHALLRFEPTSHRGISIGFMLRPRSRVRTSTSASGDDISSRSNSVNGLALAAFALIGMIDRHRAHATPATFSSHVFIFATLMVVLAIRMTFASTLPRVFLAGTVPMTIAVAGRLFTLGDPFYFALASMAVGIHVFFVYLARGLHSTALAMVEYPRREGQPDLGARRSERHFG